MSKETEVKKINQEEYEVLKDRIAEEIYSWDGTESGWGDDAVEYVLEMLDDFFGRKRAKASEEETEVRKDIEWAIKEIEGLETETSQNYPHDEMIERGIVLGILSQLDEPEVTLDRAFEKVAESYLMTKEEIWRHLEQLEAHDGNVTYGEPEVLSQELPVIPQFVAEWIEGNQEDDPSDTMHFVIYRLYANWTDTNSMVELRRPVVRWIGEDRNNYFKLIDATRYGYEVEQEQKYYARIKGWENVTTGSEAFNWVYFKEKDTVGISKAVESKYQTVSFTKYDWDNLGINEDNADFVKVEEMEE